MDSQDLKKVKKMLQDEKAQLEKQLGEFAEVNPKNREDFNATFPQIGDKDDENAAEVDTYSTNLTLERTLESALRDVKAALIRIDEGSYGVCKYCGKEIPVKRLLARPTSGACIDCKKKLTQEA